MLYLNHEHIANIGTDWEELTELIRDTVRVMDEGNFSQPVKPYLRYRDLRNRIIAMPAYTGGSTSMAGIKWIASFPDNIQKGIPRAHSVTILNEEGTGKPVCIINTNRVSAIRTAAVSGLVIKDYWRARPKTGGITIGITGFGPIGRTHLSMVESLLGDAIRLIVLYDIRAIDKGSIATGMPEKIVVASSWQECYAPADIFITCTVSDKPYIDLPPKKGSLQMNVSLRDYVPDTRKYMDIIAVDDWDEVCRQSTDIEKMHEGMGLQKEETVSITDIICRGAFCGGDRDQVVMFNPMGMAVFDIATGGYYYKSALERGIGVVLPD